MRQHQEHIPAERQIRFAQAASQLSDADADTRLAGALALIELADEWLASPAAADSLAADQPAREAQAIIHELCAYIRSPFPAVSTSSRTELAQHYMRLLNDAPEGLSRTQREQFQAEKSALTVEALVRGCILEAIHDRFVQESDYGTPRAPRAFPISKRRRATGGRGWIMIFRVPYFSTRCC